MGSIPPIQGRAIQDLRLEEPLPTGARFLTETGPLEATAYAPGIVRLRVGRSTAPDYGLLATPPETVPAPPRVTMEPAGDGFTLRADGLALTLHPSPLRFSLTTPGRSDPLLQSASDRHITGELRLPPFAAADDGWTISQDLRTGEPVYGLGEKFGPLNRRGQLVESWNRDAWGVNSEASYKNIPFAWSPRGWGVFVHTPGRVTHSVGYPQVSHRSYVLHVEDGALDLFLLAAPTPAALLERFSHLTGRPGLPPRWSYGVWMSRCYYRTPEEALAVAQRMRERRIPCDVLVLDGRAWLKVETRFGFEWDADRYPDPAAFIRTLNDLGFRVCLWEYPHVSVRNPLFRQLAEQGYLLRAGSGDPYVYRWDPEPFGELLTPLPDSGIVDFTNPAAAAWYGEAHRRLFDAGVAAMKTDFGEQVPDDAVAHNGDSGRRVHNVYALLYNRCVYEASRQHRGDEAVVWGRSGWTGSQRYPIQWGGDPEASWDGLAASIRGALSWGMSGGPYYSHDIGGFYGPKPDAELYLRWVQAGVMSSHTRFHGTTPREPWEFGEDIETLVRRWLTWRYRLLPYLEACALDAARTGAPVMRAMPLAFPDDPAAWAFEEQYLFGPALLVAPVLTPGGEARCYLPSGAWYDLQTGARVVGPRLIARTVPLDVMPLYGREGFLLPLGPEVQHTGELPEGPAVSEIWAFGIPRHDLELSGLRTRVQRTRGRTQLVDLPPGVTVRCFGGVRVEISERAVAFRPRPRGRERLVQ